MDDYDDGNDKSNVSDSGTWDFITEETQIFDNQFCDSATSSFGNKCNGDFDKLHSLQSTIPFDDTVMCEYESATQLMDPDGETQVFNPDGATQMVNLDGPTQVVNPDGPTQMVNLDGATQVVNLDTEFEEMDAFEETQLFNDYDTEEVVVSDHEGSENTEIVDDSDEDSCRSGPTQKIHNWNENMKENKPKTDCGRSEQHTSEVGFKKFTSIRVASMRAAGMSALNKASKLSKSPSCPNLSSEPDIEHRRILLQKSQSQDLEKVNESTNTLGTVSKCRFGKSIARKLFAEDPLTETKDANDIFDLGGRAKSPVLEGELTGLSYIDSQEPGDVSQANALDFVDNFLKVNCERENKKSTGGKSKAVLSAKGVQTLAKSVDLISGVDKRRIFDWDDNLEDEGGGEFFRKKKDLFFASGGRQLKASSSSRIGGKLIRSDSKLVLGKNKEVKLKNIETVVKDSTLCKNLISDLNEQSTDMPGGSDSQMAAEAMEDLCLGLQETGHDLTKQKGCHKSQPLPLSGSGVRITRSKSKMSGDQSKDMTHAKSAAKTIKTFDNVAPDAAKRTRNMSLKRRVDSVDAPVTSFDQMSVKKQFIQYETPVARRTRSMICNKLNKVKRSCQKLTSKRKENNKQSVSRLTRSKSATLTDQEKLLTKERIEKNFSVCATPVRHQTPVKQPSPICMGDEYLKQSCRKSNLIQEVSSVFPTRSLIQSPNKDTRQRKDVSLIRVVFSRHLDGDVIKHQKKILSGLGASESSSMSDATHFIADSFTRTRNMLEAIASGKPVVTHLWLESCEQFCCHIDEKKFILKDVKKEKEFGFSLSASLARARQFPLLKGNKVLITPNTKPGKEILSSLVKAVHGMAVERMGRSLLNIDKAPEGLLILSCEEDYAVCLPFLEKGAAIYSSELLLNGIVTQRLEYERHRLFLDHVKRTRSTIWVKKDDKYKAVGKVK